MYAGEGKNKQFVVNCSVMRLALHSQKRGEVLFIWDRKVLCELLWARKRSSSVLPRYVYCIVLVVILVRK